MRGSKLRWGAMAVILVSIISIIRDMPSAILIERAVSAVHDVGPLAPVFYAFLYIVAGLLFVPGSALTLGAGALFGPIVGTVVVSIASTITAALAFLIARYAARERVAAAAARSPKFAAIDSAIADGGWRVIALLRLSPAMPFSLGNYLYGLTAVRFWPYVAASGVAMLPVTFLYVQLGHLGAAGVSGGGGGSRWKWVVIGAGVVATFAATVLVTRRARRALRETALAEPVAPVAAASPASPRSAVRLVVLALVAASLAGVVHARRHSLRGLLGPPPAAMHEAWAGAVGTATFDHSALNALLAEHVRDGRVDYAALARDPSRLDAYIATLAGAPFEGLSRDDRLAFLINAYNAFTLRLIVDHWPVASIRDIPSGERWEARRWMLAGKQVSLEDIEHDWVRSHFAEPRIHFALVCAARGCPPLRSEAYEGPRVDAQLEDQARIVHADPTWLQLEGGTLRLTRLYDWYGDDFIRVDGSVIDSAALHLPALRALLEGGTRPHVVFLDYDWTLNGKDR